MKPDERDRDVDERVTTVLDKGLSTIETPVLGRLAAMRAEAVSLSPGRRSRFVARWVTAGGLAMAAAVVVAVSLWLAPVKAPQPVASVANPDDVELLISRDRLEMYEDLDFYRWLDEGRRNGG